MTEITAVFQNIDGDGLPTLLGDVVGVCEAPADKRRLRRRLRGREHFFPEKNYRMAASWDANKFRVVRRRRIKVHKAHTRPPTPRRDIIILTLNVGGREVSFIFGHAINSAWAPPNKPTTFRQRRRELWGEWAETMVEIIKREMGKGREVVVMADANRSRPPNWTFPIDDLRVAWHHGPDRVWVSKGIQVKKVEVGPKTGDGRVTHPSVRVTLNVPRKEGPNG